MKDMIYRKDAIKAMRDTLVAAEIPYAVNALFKIPSADRPQGKWIIEIDANSNTYGRCSICGMRQYAGQLNFCPNCGAKMKGEINETNY